MNLDLTPSDGDRLTAVIRAVALMKAIARVAGEGPHHLSVTLMSAAGVETADCTITGPVLDDQTQEWAVAEAGTLLARSAYHGMAMVVLNSGQADGTVTVRSWGVFDLVPIPGSAEQTKLAHCITEDRDMDSPAPGFHFVDAPELV
ncbi:hypothetical protein ACM614_17385 [Streptomyces sp. 12297]